MNEKELEQLLNDVYESIQSTEFNNTSTATRLEEYIEKNGELDHQKVINFSREEANYYSRVLLFNTIKELSRQGYLNEK